MTISKYLRYLLPLFALMALLTACEEKSDTPQPTSFNLKVDESVVITLPSSSSYTISRESNLVDYTLSGNSLTVIALKEGKTSVSVVLDSGEKCKYTFTISQNAYQGGYFKTNATPRIEAWKRGEIINTEESAGLQVSYEPGMGITGEEKDETARAYGFIYPQSGRLLRFSAQGDFTQTGALSDAIVAMRESHTAPLQYEKCTITIEKVSQGKIWFVLTFDNRSDIRIVTEVF